MLSISTLKGQLFVLSHSQQQQSNLKLEEAEEKEILFSRKASEWRERFLLMLLVYAYVDTYNKEGKAEIYAFTHSLAHSTVHNGPMLLLSSSSRYAYSWREKICFQYDKEISFFLVKLPCARDGKAGSQH